jgi:hypothetical protein
LRGLSYERRIGRSTRLKTRTRWLEYRLGITKEVPEVNPVSNTAFAFGWNNLKQDHAATLADFGVS